MRACVCAHVCIYVHVCLQSNSFQAVIVWDSCVSVAMISYGGVDWRIGHQGDQSIIDIWDGERLVNVNANTNSAQTITMAMTRACSGQLAADRQCRRDAQQLPILPITLRQFFSVNCPPSDFSFRLGAFHTDFFIDTNGHSCYVREAQFFQSFTTVSFQSFYFRAKVNALTSSHIQTCCLGDSKF